jgi:hypothetical protein
MTYLIFSFSIDEQQQPNPPFSLKSWRNSAPIKLGSELPSIIKRLPWKRLEVCGTYFKEGGAESGSNRPKRKRRRWEMGLRDWDMRRKDGVKLGMD